jgi:hypothetical protein
MLDSRVGLCILYNHMQRQKLFHALRLFGDDLPTIKSHLGLFCYFRSLQNQIKLMD